MILKFFQLFQILLILHLVLRSTYALFFVRFLYFKIFSAFMSVLVYGLLPPTENSIAIIIIIIIIIIYVPVRKGL